jgi:hypothetical protein
VGLVEEGVGRPRNDGTRGSALYRVPLRLSRTPSPAWARHFEANWDHPPGFTTMHRPGICQVVGDTVVLDGTTIEELEEVHLPTLRLVLEKVNADIAQHEAQEQAARERAEPEAQAHSDKVRDAAKRLDFGTSASGAVPTDLLPQQEDLLARLAKSHNSTAPDRLAIRITRFKGRGGVRIPYQDGAVALSKGRKLYFVPYGTTVATGARFVLQHSAFRTEPSLNLADYHLVASYQRPRGGLVQGQRQPLTAVQLYKHY